MLEPTSLSVPQRFIDTVIKSACQGDERIIEAFRTVPREFFMDEAMRTRAYIDSAQPIGYGQTISQPSLVAVMLYELDINKNHRCLEIGAGSGFLTALLSKLADEVIALELLSELTERVRTKMRAMRIQNVRVFTADGSKGMAEKAPYDRIIVSAGATSVPGALSSQLAEGGVMVIPVNGILTKAIKQNNEIQTWELARVAFVDFING